MKRTLRVGALALLPLLAWACSDRPEPAGPETGLRLSQSADRTAVIVALDPGTAPAEHAAAEARSFARGLGIQPTHLYGTALFGFAATVNQGQLNALEKNPRVTRVTEDGPVSVPDPVQADAPGGTPGPPDGGGGGTSQTVPWGVDRIGGEPGETEIGDGSDGSGSFSDVIDGVDWVASETKDLGEPTVANVSLGASRDESGTNCGSSNLHQAVCNARDVGVVFAVAAGNDGADAEGFVPANYHNAVITQSATSGDGDASNADDDWPDWSNWGDNSADWDSDSGQHAPVALAAPGVDVLSTTNDGGTGTKSGTSMASPHVAGAAALAIKEYDIEATDKTAFQDVRSNLLDIDESTDDWDNSSGNPHDEDFVDVRN